MDLQAIADRLAIEDVLTQYSYGVDTRNWAAWDECFTSDAMCDFTSQGMGRLTPPELKEVLTRSDPIRISSQHLVSNFRIQVDGDHATARSEMLCASTWRSDVPGQARLSRSGGWYDDELVRTARGWRIAQRTCTVNWLQFHDIPEQIPWAQAIPWAQERVLTNP
jgi:3-phenylpropionate/cinnamic acid dioxygenase small subunit